MFLANVLLLSSQTMVSNGKGKVCAASFIKEVSLKCGTKKLYPHIVCCYESVVTNFKDLVKRNDFTAHCELC